MMGKKVGAMNRRRFLKSSASGVAGVGMLAGWDNLLANTHRTADEEKGEVSTTRFSQSGAKRTLIKGRWVVGYDGREHRLIDDGVVVYEGDEIIHVGKSFDGRTDEVIQAKGRLVIPGLINIHAVTNICIVHFRIDGVGTGGSRTTKARMLEGITNPRAYFEGDDIRTSARFSVAGLLKGGATTIGEITAFGTTGFQPPREQVEAIAETAVEMGARMYISQPYLDGKRYTDEGGAGYHFDEEAGLKALDEAVKFCEEYEGTHGDLIRTMLFPYRFDGCSEGLLKATKVKASELGVPIHMHISQYLSEFHEIVRRYGKTPVHFLHDIGFLGPKTILTHLLYTSLNPMSPAPNAPIRDPRDIEMLADAGTTLGHTPAVWARYGLPLHSYAKFRDAGVNIAIGTDSFPMDMFMEMRYAAIMGKTVERERSAVTAGDVFNASTLGGAKALERSDLGRLAPGAKADIVIVDLTGLHTALTYDPIRTMVYFASQSDIETVIVDGKKVVEGGRIPGLDEEKLAREADGINHRFAERRGETYPTSIKSWGE
jgi:cytosine/adenosine deaminase-related metal-dependent hydrolase